MDRGKLFILVLVIIVAILFLGGVLYIIANFVFKDALSPTPRDPRVKYTELNVENIKFDKIEDSSEINYNFKIES